MPLNEIAIANIVRHVLRYRMVGGNTVLHNSVGDAEGKGGPNKGRVCEL